MSVRSKNLLVSISALLITSVLTAQGATYRLSTSSTGVPGNGRSDAVAVAAKSAKSQAARAALSALVRLYEAWDKPDDAKRYQQRLDEWGR
jgi:exo-beta-1,3-glucanase (GH17 family)